MDIPRRVGIFEDDESVRGLISDIVAMDGHDIVAEAASMREALEIIAGLGRRALDVAFVDGNLTPGITTGADGAEIARLLRETVGEEVVVVGFSGSNDIPGAAYNLRKPGNPIRDIPEIFASL